MLLFNRLYRLLRTAYNKFQNILCYCLTHIDATAAATYVEFQNILCYCLTLQCYIYIVVSFISKHPMLLFNHIIINGNSRFCIISKHPMLLFNNKFLSKGNVYEKISKHPMLLFNFFAGFLAVCQIHFKTSYVTV